MYLFDLADCINCISRCLILSSDKVLQVNRRIRGSPATLFKSVVFAPHQPLSGDVFAWTGAGYASFASVAHCGAIELLSLGNVPHGPGKTVLAFDFALPAFLGDSPGNMDLRVVAVAIFVVVSVLALIGRGRCRTQNRCHQANRCKHASDAAEISNFFHFKFPFL